MVEENLKRGSSNTPLHCTVGNTLEACIDWFSCTFKEKIFSRVFCELLHLTVDDFEVIELARNNEYDYKYKFQNYITVMTRNETADKHALTHIDITGKGCRFLENNWREGFDWIDFFSILRDCYTIHHITRLDGAIDDYEGYLNITTMHRKVRLKHFKSTAGSRSWRYIESGDIQSEQEINGQTLYFGKGDVEFRFYDKLNQVKHALHVEVPEGIDFWNRYEIQLRHDRALSLFTMIADGRIEIGVLLRSILAEYLTFLVENKNDSNKRRWATCSWWTKFLADCVEVKLTMQPLEKTVERTKHWIEYQGAVSLAILNECFNDNGAYFRGLIADGQSRMTKEHRKMIEIFKRSEKNE